MKHCGKEQRKAFIEDDLNNNNVSQFLTKNLFYLLLLYKELRKDLYF